MPRIALLLEYDGAKFCGSQNQAGVRTVQGDVESAIGILARRPVPVIFSGRTDSGVHAAGQVAHLDWPDDVEMPDLWRFNWSLNGILKQDVAIVKSQVVPETFHARWSALSREYVYRILNRPQRSGLLRDTHYFVPFELNLEAMNDAALHLPGDHDFASFRSTNSDRGTSVCRVSRAELLSKSESLLEFWISANHFVYNMVRIIVGTLIEIGLDKKKPGTIADALASNDRNLAGPTAPAWGLCLNSVQYPISYNLFGESSFRRPDLLPDRRSNS